MNAALKLIFTHPVPEQTLFFMYWLLTVIRSWLRLNWQLSTLLLLSYSTGNYQQQIRLYMEGFHSLTRFQDGRKWKGTSDRRTEHHTHEVTWRQCTKWPISTYLETTHITGHYKVWSKSQCCCDKLVDTSWIIICEVCMSMYSAACLLGISPTSQPKCWQTHTSYSYYVQYVHIQHLNCTRSHCPPFTLPPVHIAGIAQ